MNYRYSNPPSEHGPFKIETDNHVDDEGNESIALVMWCTFGEKGEDGAYPGAYVARITWEKIEAPWDMPRDVHLIDRKDVAQLGEQFRFVGEALKHAPPEWAQKSPTE